MPAISSRSVFRAFRVSGSRRISPLRTRPLTFCHFDLSLLSGRIFLSEIIMRRWLSASACVSSRQLMTLNRPGAFLSDNTSRKDCQLRRRWSSVICSQYRCRTSRTSASLKKIIFIFVGYTLKQHAKPVIRQTALISSIKGQGKSDIHNGLGPIVRRELVGCVLGIFTSSLNHLVGSKTFEVHFQLWIALWRVMFFYKSLDMIPVVVCAINE